MCKVRKARIAYAGPALDDGSMPVRDLAPALISFADLVDSSYKAIGGEGQVKVLLNQDSLRKGSFDITFLMNLDILGAVKLFMTSAESSGLDDLMTVLGWGVTGGTAGKGIFWLVKKIGGRKLRDIKHKKDQKAEIVLEDGETIETTENTLKVFLSVDCRVSLERIVAPVKGDGIDAFELRDPEDAEKDEPIIKIDKLTVPSFKAPPASDVMDIEEQTQEQEILARIISVNFEQGKWRFSDGTNAFWASIADETFISRVERGEISFTKGDTLRIRCYIKQSLKGNHLASEHIITKVLELKRAPRLIGLDFQKSDAGEADTEEQD